LTLAFFLTLSFSQARLQLVEAALNEVLCHYKMASSRLKALVTSYVPMNTANADNLEYFLGRNANSGDRSPPTSEEDRRVSAAYQECCQLQQRWNVLNKIRERIHVHLGDEYSPSMKARMAINDHSSSPESHAESENLNYDRLKTVTHHLLNSACSAAFFLSKVSVC
jgi:hypothetical protein